MREHYEQPSARELEQNHRRAAALPIERAQQIRMLVILAFIAVIFSVLRAGIARVFTVGWFRLW